MLFIVLALQFLLFRSRWGLRTRAVGEHPRAADTVGINVIRLRYRNVIAGCALAGLAGAFLTLESTGSFQNGMTNGRGFIALAAMIFGRWTPIGSFLGALLFGTATALGIIVTIQPPSGDLGAVMIGDPQLLVRRPAVHRDGHRPGGRRRAQHPARRRRHPVREGGCDLRPGIEPAGGAPPTRSGSR